MDSTKKKIKQDQTGRRTTITIQIYNILEMDAFDLIKS